MMYFHHGSCISPQQTFGTPDLKITHPSENNWLTVIEPKYENIPRGLLRRMGKAVRKGVGAALPLFTENNKIDGIILGTANGGMEDCIKFLNQVIEFDEGTLTPTNFVQSTTNAIAGQIGLMAQKTGYNATHVHRGLSFENALLDAFFIASENPENQYLVGGVDEISTYNYNIDFLAGWYKKENLRSAELYKSTSAGSLAGEAAAMFVVSAQPENAVMKLAHLKTIHTQKPIEVKKLAAILAKEFSVDAIISGENGDCRQTKYYEQIEEVLPSAPVYRYKHLCGEFPTSVAFAAWVAMQVFENSEWPAFLNVKKSPAESTELQTILVYNTYHGNQHSFMVLQGCS